MPGQSNTHSTDQLCWTHKNWGVIDTFDALKIDDLTQWHAINLSTLLIEMKIELV